MKDIKKKVIASMLAISMAFSPLQILTFADGNSNAQVPQTYESPAGPEFPPEVVRKMFELKEKNENFNNKWFWQRWFADEETKKDVKRNDIAIDLMQGIIDCARYVNKDISNVKVESILEQAYGSVDSQKSSSGLKSILLWIKKNILFNPFTGTMLALQVFDIVRGIWRHLKTKIEAGKVEKPIDPATTMKILEIMMSRVKGQEKAKEQIKRIVLNIVDQNSRFQAEKRNKKAGPGATVVYMVGPSGVGKSFSADIIRKVLAGFNAEPFVIEASDIDKQSKSSAVEQLFGMRIKRANNSEYYEYAPFIQRIKSIPNTVVVINEYDKMHTPELDEKLRTIMDQGYINVNGEKIDCSAATFIITSNESSGSANKGNKDIDYEDDGTGSRTFINHDKAFLNRIKLIEFDNLTAADYVEIAIPYFLELAGRYKEQYGINLDLNGTIFSIAQRVESLNKGARPIFDFLDSLNDKLLNEVVLKNLNKNASNNINYKVSFKDDNFFLEDMNKKGNADEVKFTSVSR